MVPTYGTVGGMERRSERRRGAAKAGLLGGMVVCGVAAAVALQWAGGRGGGGRAVLTDLDTSYPSALDDLFSHVNVSGKKAWMRQVYANAQGTKLLHPLADIDPFSNQPLDGSSYEAMLRAHATKATSDTWDAAAQAEMDTAQQTARDVTGADAGCTHRDLNQTDYAGTQATSVTGQACLSWQAAYDDNLQGALFDPLVYTSLTGADCRNPGASKLGAWCFLEGATSATTDLEGELWEYCDVGARCEVDMPILRPENGEGVQQLRDVGSRVADLAAGRAAWSAEEELRQPARGRAASGVGEQSLRGKGGGRGGGGASARGGGVGWPRRGAAQHAERARHGQLQVFTGDQAREAMASKGWLQLDKMAGRVNPKIGSYETAAQADEELRKEGLM